MRPILAVIVASALVAHTPDLARAEEPTPPAALNEAPPPKRIGPKLSALSAAALVGLGVFFSFEAQSARAHDIHPTDDEQQKASIFSFATYMSLGLAAVSLIVTTVLLLGESSNSTAR